MAGLLWITRTFRYYQQIPRINYIIPNCKHKIKKSKFNGKLLFRVQTKKSLQSCDPTLELLPSYLHAGKKKKKKNPIRFSITHLNLPRPFCSRNAWTSYRQKPSTSLSTSLSSLFLNFCNLIPSVPWDPLTTVQYKYLVWNSVYPSSPLPSPFLLCKAWISVYHFCYIYTTTILKIVFNVFTVCFKDTLCHQTQPFTFLGGYGVVTSWHINFSFEHFHLLFHASVFITLH